MTQENIISIFGQLGTKLGEFGTTNTTIEVVEKAVQVNGWFTSHEIICAVQSICTQMLQPNLVEKWLSMYHFNYNDKPLNVGLIAAGNLPLVGFFDLLCIVASGNRCLVKPSNKDSVMMEYICRLLHEIDPNIAVSHYTQNIELDAVVATGSENTNRYFRSIFNNIPALLRSGRGSIAVLNNQEGKKTLQLLSNDIFSYSGLGCRNVSLLFVPMGLETKEIAEKLPHPTHLNPKYRHNYLQRRAVLTIEGAEFVDGEFFVITDRCTLPTDISEIAVCRYNNIKEVDSWLALNDKTIQCIVSNSYSHQRVVAIGQTQNPSLNDYPDGVDTMKFLEKLI